VEQKENCESYNSSGECLACDEGYQLAEDTDVCVEQKENCESYNSSGECLACEEG